MWQLFPLLQPPSDDSKRPNLKNIVFINNNVMKCKQKVNTPPIPSLLTSQQEGISGDSINKGGEPFEKLHTESCQTHEKQGDTRCQSKNPVIKCTEILSYGLDKIRLNL